MRWYELVVEGQACHAGTTPMEVRRDPFRALVRVVDRLYALAENYAPEIRLTFGSLIADPGVVNTVPRRLVLSVDLRHPEQSVLDAFDARLSEIVSKECALRNTPGSVRCDWSSPPLRFDAGCVAAVRRAAERLGYAAQEMVSGAGHDAVYVAGVAPTSMIFVPCERGLSHNEAEYSKPEDLSAGCNVLLHAILDRDRESV